MHAPCGIHISSEYIIDAHVGQVYFFKTYDMALRMLERFRFSQLCKAEYIHGFRKHCRIIHCSGLFSHEPNYVRSTDTTQKSQDCQETIRSAKLEEDAPREFCICTSRDVSQWMLWMTGKAVTHPRLPSFCGKGSSLGNTAPTDQSLSLNLSLCPPCPFLSSAFCVPELCRSIFLRM